MGNLPFKDSKGRIYACTWGGDVKVYDPSTGKAVYFKPNPTTHWPYYTKVISSLVEDDEGNVWIATWRGGVYRYNPSTGKVKRFLYYPDGHPELVNKAVKGMQKDNKGTIWVATDKDIWRFDISQLCRALGTSRTQLHKKLTALTNKSTSHVIRSIRLRKAMQLLQTTDLNASEVSYTVGFTNHSHFTAAFREEFGQAPSFYRKE